MLIKCFSVKNFRSIKETSELPIYNLSILIGPNNEGKSNILQALVITLRHLSNPELIFGRRRGHSIPRDHIAPKRYRTQERTDYRWDRDFPLSLQEKYPNGKSILIIDFSLSKREKYLLQKRIKHKLIGGLRLKLELGRNQVKLSAIDTFNPKKIITSDFYGIIQLISFIRKNVMIQYIPAIRTSNNTRDIIDDMISAEIEHLQYEKEYRNLLEKLNQKQKPILARLSDSLTKSVSGFLPDIKKIELDSQDRFRRIIHESCDILIDDGTKTPIDLKGDGIKNLLAISIIHHTTQQSSLNKSIILAIEEPESHLHPEAIHQLRKVIEEISDKNQVIITTHSPLLISRAIVKKNLLVYKSKATAAKNIAEIRNLLGVKVSDNLVCANIVILTEGEEEKEIIKTWISCLSPSIKSAVEQGKITFDHLNGSSNLCYKITQWKSLLCDVFVFLDGDDAGEKAFTEAETKQLISEKEVCFAKIRSYPHSEIEDLINTDCYIEKVYNKYGVRLEGNSFKNNKKKWSDRVRDTFIENGKRWPKGREVEIKKLVSQEAIKVGLDSLQKHHLPYIKNSINYLEEYLKLN